MRGRALVQAHRKMRLHAGSLALGKVREFGRECECQARALRGHKELRRR